MTTVQAASAAVVTGDEAEDLRLLLIGDGWYEEKPGGLNRYWANLLRSLRDAGVSACGVIVGPASASPTGVQAVGTDRQPLPLRLWCHRRAVRDAAADATLVDSHFALYAFMPMVLGELRRLPLVVHFQGPWAEESLLIGSAPLRVAAKRLIETSVYRRARRVIVLSAAFKRILVERYRVSPWPVRVVPPGVDLVRFRPGDRRSARARLGLPEDRRVAVAVRRLAPRMGLDVLLEAWARLDSRSRALLLVAGEGPERGRLEALAARLRIESSVRFLGNVDDDQLVALYQAADVSVVPSVALEGFGLVVLEALACGTPVIATDAGGLPEALAAFDPRLIVPAGMPDPLAHRLDGALGGTTPAPDRDRCRRYAESFSWQQVARRHMDIYQQALRPSPRNLRVVYLDHCAQLSGGELALLRLLRALGDVDAHVVLAEEGPLVGKLLQSGISVEVLPMAEIARGVPREHVRPRGMPGRITLHSAAYTGRLAQRLRRLNPDLVHSNSLKAALYGGVAARAARLPLVWHVRDRIAPDYLPPAAVRLVRAMARRLPDAVITDTRSTLATLGGVSTAISAVIPSPVELEPLTASNVGEREGREQLRVGIVGRLAPWKGQHVFLDAFSQAFPTGTERAVVVGAPLFGEAEYECQLKEQAHRLGLGARVEFTGFRDDVRAELAGLDVLVHASVIPEPFGQVVAEGMAMGLPVVAPSAGGPAELIDDSVTGLLYPPRDAAALARALRHLAGDPELRRRLGAKARERAIDFAPRAIADRVMVLYRQVLEERLR